MSEQPLTPTEFFETELGPFWLKREDLNETGSHKDRAARRQVEFHASRGERAVILSSSGNAARATAAAARRFLMPAYAFMSDKTPASKVRDVYNFGGTAILTGKAINLSNYVTRVFQLPNLRPSECDEAVRGFASLGEELLGEYEGARFDSVFSFSSSGASLQALAEVLVKSQFGVSIHAVQAGDGQIVGEDDDSWRQGQAPRTGGLCARSSPRAPAIRELMKSSGGRGWLVTDAEVDAAQRELWDSGRMVSREAAAAFAAAQRALRLRLVRAPMVVLTGIAVEDSSPVPQDDDRVVRLKDYLDTREFFENESRRWPPRDRPDAKAA